MQNKRRNLSRVDGNMQGWKAEGMIMEIKKHIRDAHKWVSFGFVEERKRWERVAERKIGEGAQVLYCALISNRWRWLSMPGVTRTCLCVWKRERQSVCLLCINVLPFANAALISCQVRESTSTVIHQWAAEGWMGTPKEERVTGIGGGRGSSGWMSGEKEKETDRMRRDDDECLDGKW